MAQFSFYCDAWGGRTTLADRLSGRPVTFALPSRRRNTGAATATATTRLDVTSNPYQGGSTKENQQEMLRFMDQPMESTVGDSNNDNDDETTIQRRQAVDRELEDLVHCIVRAADSRKAEDVVALRVRHVTTLCSYLVILSGNSRPQNQAIAAAIRDAVEEQYDGLRPGGTGVPEGSAESGWMLLDYGTVMCHIMTPKSRLFYNVEGQWRDKGGQYLDLTDYLIPNSPTEEDTIPSYSFDENNEEDPFWS